MNKTVHFSKNSLGSQKYLSVRSCIKYENRTVSNVFLGKKKEKIEDFEEII